MTFALRPMSLGEILDRTFQIWTNHVAIAAAIWLGSCFSLAFPAGALEPIGGVRVLQRSWRISRGSRLKIASTWLTNFVTSWLLMWGFQALARRVLIFLYWNAHFHLPPAVYTASIYACYALLVALIRPIYPIAITLFYYDQRIRKEGYDIERLMDAAGLSASAPPGSATAGGLLPQSADSVEAEVQTG